MPPRVERPPDADYYERDRVELFSQGDLFRDVPLAYPLPADELVVDESSGGTRRFLSGPLEFGPAMLITPSCSLGAQGATGYGHPVRTLVPLIPFAEFIDHGIVKETALADLRRFDHLINYMYLPTLAALQLVPDNSGRIARLEAAVQLVVQLPTDEPARPLTQGHIREWLEHSPFASYDDPLNTTFTEEIMFFGGSYVVFPGPVEQ